MAHPNGSPPKVPTVPGAIGLRPRPNPVASQSRNSIRFASLFMLRQILFSRQRGGERERSGALAVLSLATAAMNGVLALELFGRAILDPEVLAQAGKTASGSGASVLVGAILAFDAAILLVWGVRTVALPWGLRFGHLLRAVPKRVRDEVYWIRNRKEILRRLEEIDQQLRQVDGSPNREKEPVTSGDRR